MEALYGQPDRHGIDIFKTAVRTGAESETAVTKWLDGDDRRRMLLLIDEADNFIRSEAESSFKCIEAMLKLNPRPGQHNRFKFVLAGLNVSRIIRAENSPLVQISNNPLRIGPWSMAMSMTPNSWFAARWQRWIRIRQPRRRLAHPELHELLPGPDPAVLPGIAGIDP